VGISRLVIENCAVATVDPGRGEHASGHLAVESGRIVAVGATAGPTPKAMTIRIAMMAKASIASSGGASTTVSRAAEPSSRRQARVTG